MSLDFSRSDRPKGVANGDKSTNKKNGPGRPPKSATNVKDAILDAAELLFADRGYSDTSLREVATNADVTQAMINYYFQGKQNLYCAVFLRRAEHISRQRLEQLEALNSQPSPSVPSLVKAFLRPIQQLQNHTQGKAFIRLHARLHTEPPAVSYSLRQKAYDKSTQVFITAIKNAVPGLTQQQAAWRVVMMVGAYLYAMSDANRIDQLVGDEYQQEKSEEILEHMVDFLTAGISVQR